jgi:signal transduction histidine kinase
MDGQGWRRFSGVAFLAVVLAVGAVQVAVFRADSTAVGLKTLTEALVFLTVAGALVFVPFSEKLSSVDADAAARVYPPIVLGLGLVAVHSVSDLLEEFLVQSAAFSTVFEDLTLFLGIVSLLIGVLRWNDHHERQAELLQRQRNRLEAQNDRLERFASVVSHDLRNPIDVARGRLRFARETGDDEHFEEASTALDRMETIVSEVLTLVDAGEESIDPERVPLGSVAREAWRTVDTAEAELAVVGDTTVLADGPLLRQLFENLLRNSVEHGSTSSRPEADDSVEHSSTGSWDSKNRGDSVEHGVPESDQGGGVTVRVGGLPDGFYVEDDGPGIDPGDREEVFDAGYTTSRSGTGLGLNIVAEIASAHGWTVEVTESEAGGARFEFSGVEFDAAATSGTESPAV